MARRKWDPTDEERESWEAKKLVFRELCQKIAAMSEDDRQAIASSAPVATTEGRILSAKNQCIAKAQREDATIVGGFQQWRKSGRCVRKGEHGFKILAPSKYPKKDDGEEGSLRFVPVTVFDVSQTDELDTA